MRRNFPLLSQQVSDIILTAYEHYVYLLGYDNDNGVTLSTGIYDTIETEYEDYAQNYLIFRNDITLSDVNTSGSITNNLDKVDFALKLLRRSGYAQV